MGILEKRHATLGHGHSTWPPYLTPNQTIAGDIMTLSRRTILAAFAATPLTPLLPRAAFAAYPDRPIKLIVPFAPGGNADFVARLTGEGMSQVLGQPIVNEFRTGAGGSLGANEAARAAPDGYTLLTGSNGPLTVNPFVQAKLGYDPMVDFIPIGLSSSTPHCIVAHESIPVKTLPELVALSKQRQITIGFAGVGSATHLTLARVMAATGATFTPVPYRGGGALVPDMLSGAINGAITEISTALPHYQGGKVRVVAIASTARSPQARDVATMTEAGVKDFTAASFVGILAPAKTPRDIVALLESALGKALSVKATQDKLLAGGAELTSPQLQTSKGFGAYLKAEYERSREAAKLAGLKPQ
jgi:tripartite-type tricarboxylate transporter receptor subunit TctC